MDRREFLEHTGISATAAAIEKVFPGKKPPEVKPEHPSPEYLLSCEPNPNLGLVNLFALPQSLYAHWDKEMYLANLNFGNMYRTDIRRFPNHVNSLNKEGGNIWEYGKGIEEAIKRKQPVFLVLDFPWQDISLEDWKIYVEGIARTYPAPFFVFDNELDVPEKKIWRENLKLFGDYFLAAASVIREVSPSSKILTPAETYKGDGKIFKNLAEMLRDQIDGFAIHVYSRAGLIKQRIEFYQKIAQDLGLSPLPFYITELGKTEGKILIPEEHRRAVIQGVATALASIPKEVKCAIWHTAYAPNDPADHSLSFYDDQGILRLKPAGYAYWDLARLLHHKVTIQVDNGLTKVSGYTSKGDRVEIVWNNLIRTMEPEERYYKGIRLSSSSNPAVEGEVIISFRERLPIDIPVKTGYP